MGPVDVMDVYRKIKEINYRNNSGIKPTCLESIVNELNGTKEIIQEYVTALTLLDMIQPVDGGVVVVA